MEVPGEITECMSLINKTNSKGPKIDPWGTPDNTSDSIDKAWSTTTLCLLPLGFDSLGKHHPRVYR